MKNSLKGSVVALLTLSASAWAGDARVEAFFGDFNSAGGQCPGETVSISQIGNMLQMDWMPQNVGDLSPLGRGSRTEGGVTFTWDTKITANRILTRSRIENTYDGEPVSGQSERSMLLVSPDRIKMVTTHAPLSGSPVTETICYLQRQ